MCLLETKADHLRTLPYVPRYGSGAGDTGRSESVWLRKAGAFLWGIRINKGEPFDVTRTDGPKNEFLAAKSPTTLLNGHWVFYGEFRVSERCDHDFLKPIWEGKSTTSTVQSTTYGIVYSRSDRAVTTPVKYYIPQA